MGIDGLWKELEPLREEVHLASRFGGRVIGVDGDHLLHSVVGGSVLDLVHGEYQSLVDRFVRQLSNLSRRCGVSFLVAFDGGDPPMKAEEQRRRQEKKELARVIGLELLQLGFEREGEAVLKKAPPVGACLGALAASLRRKGFEVIQAPMEAEAQLAFMNRRGQIDAVWTGDSDAVMYFADRIIRNIDVKTCTATVYECGDTAAWSRVGGIAVHEPPLFVLMCVMGGSDYSCHRSSSLRVVGRLLADKRVTTFTDAFQLISSEYRLNAEERELITSAVGAFLYHWVFDRDSGKVVHNFAPPRSSRDLQVPGRDVLGEPPANPVAFCREGVGLDSSDVPLVRRAFDKYRFLSDSDRSSFNGPFDCQLCQVNCNSAEMLRTHRDGVFHKGLELIRQHRSTAVSPPEPSALSSQRFPKGTADVAGSKAQSQRYRSNGELDIKETLSMRIAEPITLQPQSSGRPPTEAVDLAALSALRLGGSGKAVTSSEPSPPAHCPSAAARDVKTEAFVKQLLLKPASSAQPSKAISAAPNLAPKSGSGSGWVRIRAEGKDGANLAPLATLLTSEADGGQPRAQRKKKTSKGAQAPNARTDPSLQQRTDTTSTRQKPEPLPPKKAAHPLDSRTTVNTNDGSEAATQFSGPNVPGNNTGPGQAGRSVHTDPVPRSTPTAAALPSGFQREVFVEDE